MLGGQCHSGISPFTPSAAKSGHVMPSFPHTLIGLGPFADLGCNIVFTKTSVIVYHPDGHPSLSGWRDETGPCLWHFPLTAEAAQVALDEASPQPTIPSPPQRAPPADVVSTPRTQKHVSVSPRTQKRVSVSTRKQKNVSVSTRKLKRSCHAAVKQRRHKSSRRQVTFLLPAHHVDKDSTIWRRVHRKERTTCPIDPLEAHSPAPIIAPLTGNPHPSQGIPATSTTGAACLCTTSMVQPRLSP